MIEYVIVIVSAIAFLGQYIYVLGKLSAKMQNCEKNVEWIRDFLLTKCTDSTHFKQESAIQVNGNLEKAIPISWKDTLDIVNIDTANCKSPIDCVVALSENQGHIRLKHQAERLGIPHNDFLLASGIYLYNKQLKEKNGK